MPCRLSGGESGAEGIIVPRSLPGSSSSGIDFSTKSAAPSSRARSASDASLNPVNITTLVSGQTARMAGRAWMPSHVGIEVSSSSRSGSWRITRLIASSPSPPSPTTSKSPDFSSRPRTSARSWLRVVDQDDREPGAVVRARHTSSSAHRVTNDALAVHPGG